MITASFPGVMFRQLHYRHLDMDKTIALKLKMGNYNKNMVLSDEPKYELSWWASSVKSSYNIVRHGLVDIARTTDASKTGWGCSLGNISTGGPWDPEASQQHLYKLVGN